MVHCVPKMVDGGKDVWCVSVRRWHCRILALDYAYTVALFSQPGRAEVVQSWQWA